MSVRYESRMSDSDALLWNNERDPMLRSTIVALMLLDAAPDPERAARAVERSLARIPRLRQRVALDPFAVAPPRWESDPHFDLAYHVRRLRAPGAGRLRDLFDLVEPIAMQAFDKDRALWELYQVDGLEGGRTAIAIKLHHAVSDGVGLVRMTSSLVERSREPEPERAGAPRRSLFEEPAEGPRGAFEKGLDALRYRAGRNLDTGSRAAAALARGALGLLRSPLGTLEDATRLAQSLGRTLRPISEPLSPLLRGRSLGVRFDVLSVALEELKRPARAVGGTLNDAFVAAVLGGLRRYHGHHGRPVESLRMTMPINLREGEQGDRAGNQFAPARFAVPLSIEDPAERMRAIREAVRRERSEPALLHAEDVASVLCRLPRALSVQVLGSMLKAIDFVTSNVPGPPFPVYMAGARVERMFGFGPLSGAALNVTLFSYDGSANLAVNSDPAAVPDPDFLSECLEKGLAEVLSVA